MENNASKKCSRKHYDNLKVPYFLYCLGTNACFQVEWQQIIGMFGLSSKVDGCGLFFSRRIIGVEMVVERRKQKVSLKLNKHKTRCY